MPNEFVARNGVIALNTSQITGSLLVTGGNIGIGTASPSQKLHIYGTGDQSLFVENVGTYHIYAGLSSNVGYIGSSNATPLSLRTNGSSRVYINTGGSVGIGTTSPSNLLDVTTNLDAGQRVAIFRNLFSTGYTSIAIDRPNTARYSFLEHTTAGTTDWYVGTGYNGGGANSAYQIGTGINLSDAKLMITTGGNVGIGTTSPTALLNVSSSTAASVLRVDTAGGTGLFVSGSGNVGINTTAPVNKLHIVGSSSTDENIAPVFITHDFSGTHGFGLVISRDASTTIAALSLGSDNNNNAIIASNNSNLIIGKQQGSTLNEYIRINTSGNVGIGTTSPQSKLEIGGIGSNGTPDYGALTLSSGSSGLTLGWDSTNNRSYIYSRTSGLSSRPLEINATMYVIGYGSVGIGSSSPTALLNVSSSTAASVLRVDTAGGAGTLFVSGSGNVGIGTTSPSTILNIASAAPVIRLNPTTQNNTTAVEFGVLNASINAYAKIDAVNEVTYDTNLRFYTNTSTSTTQVERMRISRDGSVGIGTTSPSAPLHISATNASNRGVLSLTESSSGGPFISFYGGSTYRAYIEATSTALNIVNFNAGSYGPVILNPSSGNVGIGTTSPTLARLQVNGNVWATSFTGSFSGSVTAPGSNTQVIYNSSGVLAGSNNFVFTGTNLGLGATPSAWGSNMRAIQLGSGGSLFQWTGSNGQISLGSNLYDDGAGNQRYIGSFAAGQYVISNNSHIWYIAPSGTAGNAISWTQAMALDASGRLGIGTTSPGARLEVAGNGTGKILIGDIGGYTNYAGISLNGSTAAGYYNILSRASDGTLLLNRPFGDIAFWENNATLHMVIKGTSGNVGIGTTSPAARLDVNGNAIISGSFTVVTGSSIEFQVLQTSVKLGNASTDTITITGSLYQSGSTVAASLRGSGSAVFSVDGTSGRLFQVDDSLTGSLFSVNTAGGLPVIEAFSDNTVRIGQFGQRALYVSQSVVGVGLENPTAKLHVSGTTGGVFEVDGASAATILYVSASGNVGINTTTPTLARLQVNGNVWATSYTGSFSGSITAPGSSNNVIYNSSGVLAGSNSFVFTGTSVGIGTTSPGARLTIQGDNSALGLATLALINGTSNTSAISFNINATPSSTYTYIVGDGRNSSGYMSFYTSDVVRIYIKGDGNVGIGTTNPVYRLQIGNLTATSTATPEVLSLGGTYSNTAGSNVKFRVYDNGSEVGGMGVSAGQTEVNTWGSGKIAFYRGTTQSMIIDANGNVGIGTTSPNHMLDIYTNKTGNGAGSTIRLNRPDNASYENAINWATNGTNFWFLGSDNDSTNNFYLYNWVRGAFELTVLSGSGNVGINTSSPTLAKLQVNGNVWATSFTGSFSGSITAPGSNTNVIYNSSGVLAGSNSFVFNGTNVGIGTTSPATRLHVAGSTQGVPAGGVARLGFADSSSIAVFTNGDPAYGTLFGTLSNGNGWIQQQRIDGTATAYNLLLQPNGGNVGIGTTSPTDVLHLYSSGLDKFLKLENTNSYTGIWMQDSGANNGWLLVSGYTNVASPGDFAIREYGVQTSLTIKSGSGSVGIGTTIPDYRLHVQSTTGTVFSIDSRQTTTGAINTGPTMLFGGHDGVNARDFATIAGLKENGTSGNYAAYLAFSTRPNGGSNTERMRIVSDGNVGIGTTSPNEKLHVAGNIHAYAASGIDAGLFSSTAAGSTTIAIRSNGITHFNGGNVGIGTTAPAARLSITPASSYVTLRVNNSSGGASDEIFQRWAYIDTSDNYYLDLKQTVTSGVVRYNFSMVNNSTAYNNVLVLDRGSVGIGTTSPSSKLFVNTGGTGSVANGIGMDNGAQQHFWYLENDTTSVYNIGSVSGQWKWSNSNGTHVTITSGGNVGIGTTAPSYKLTIDGGSSEGAIGIERDTVGTNTVIGALNFTNNNAGNVYGRVRGGRNAAGDGYVSLGTGVGDNLYALEGGNVGIGTTTPAARLDVRSLASAGSTASPTFRAYGYDLDSYFEINNNASNSANITLTRSDAATMFSVNGHSGLAYFAGNVGIGSASPGYKLDVVENANTFAASVTNTNSNGSAGGLRIIKSNGGQAALYIDNTGGYGNAATILGGNVGIGSASPTYTLDVNGTGRFTSLIETSTRTLKSNIEPYATDIDKFKQLEPVSFTWNNTGKQDVGLIAEDVEQIFPEFVSKTDEGEITGINYGKLSTIFINVLKQQQQKIELLEEQIKKLTS